MLNLKIFSMKIKKNPKANLEHYSKVFTLLGLVLALYVSYVFIEHKTYAAVKPITLVNHVYEDDVTVTMINLPEPKIQQVKVQAPKDIPEPIDKELVEITDPTQVDKVDDKKDIIEATFEDTSEEEPTEEEILESLDGDDMDEPEEVGVETVPFTSSVTAPVFPGCEKYVGNKIKSKKCFNKKIAKFFGKNFDTSIAEDAGLIGVQKIHCRFVVNNKGEISPQIQVSRTEQIVSDEIKEVLKKLPKMKPATQNGKTVNLIYDLPVKFAVE